MATTLTSRAEDYSQRYNDLVKYADLAENSAVRGCMIIKPYGPVSFTHFRAPETSQDLLCRLLLEKIKTIRIQ